MCAFRFVYSCMARRSLNESASNPRRLRIRQSANNGSTRSSGVQAASFVGTIMRITVPARSSRSNANFFLPPRPPGVSRSESSRRSFSARGEQREIDKWSVGRAWRVIVARRRCLLINAARYLKFPLRRHAGNESSSGTNASVRFAVRADADARGLSGRAP